MLIINPKTPIHAAKFQRTPMHPCATGPDTVQGFASEPLWISLGITAYSCKNDPTTQCMQANYNASPCIHVLLGQTHCRETHQNPCGSHIVYAMCMQSMMVSCKLDESNPQCMQANSANSDASMCCWARHIAGYGIEIMVDITRRNCLRLQK